ncbi:MAG: glutamate 5-kinase [Lysobacterales bacterium]|nr:MAG: glutamate 5-kinase [Xanthomonadales bacterium]
MTQRIVVKIGSQVLCDKQGALNREVMASLVLQVAGLAREGRQLLLVSSGAVAAGSGIAGSRLERIADPVARRQVLAATGQVRLMETYRALFEQHGLTVAQVLASKSDFQTRRHYLNMRGCIEALLGAGIVPIVNENDVVSITELMFTDNDELAGLLAGMVNADLLCLLSTVPGVFDGDPDDSATRCIETWDPERHQLEDIVQRGTSALGRGGMHSKLAIALKAARLGTEVVIADGTDPDVLLKVVNAQSAGTRFPAQGEASSAKRWLASADGHATGAVTVNAGAETALLDRSRLASLLPVGVEDVEGSFSAGDVIRIRNAAGKVLGCGRARYDHEEARRLMGQRGQKPLIHYDYLYLLK